MPQKNLVVFIVLAFVILVGFTQLRVRLWQQPVPKKVEPVDDDETQKAEAPGSAPALRGDGARFALGPGGSLAWRLHNKPARLPAPVVVPPTDPLKLIHLGSSDRDAPSHFHLDAELDPRGAGVRSVVLNKFARADKEGRPVWKPGTDKVPEPLELIPGDANKEIPAFALYTYDPRDLSDDHPLDTLGHTVWTVVKDKDSAVSVEQTTDGRQRQSVGFRTEVDGVTITKTFSLTEGDYHLGLEVKLSKKDDVAGTKDRPFRYQLAGGRGLPVEGEWYTNIFRNALIARVERGSVYRDLQDLRQISIWDGGNEVVRDKDLQLRYAGVAVQYFASVIAVDNEQKHTDFLLKARPTLETAVTKGKVKSIAVDRQSIVLIVGERAEQTFYIRPGSDLDFTRPLAFIREGDPLAVIHRSDGVMEDGKLRAVAVNILPQAEAQPLFIDDITVRVSTEPFELKPGTEPVTHKYVLYHGPVKAMLLGQLTGDAAVPPEVVDRYLNDLNLNTLTDYQSSGFIGRVTSSLYWSQLIIHCTNIMHEVLNWLHKLIPNYGICIILLTVLVRGIMFPVSRKQAMTSIRMQELAPELKKLQEKLKDDKQALGLAQMDLYRKHGVNPFGSCWFLLLQMPIFMGLYYCLQESIHFRLAQFWPSWIINLAAPDMLIKWGDRIPYLSRPEDYGGMIYLGPYFNLLPVIAVTLMIFQQKFTMPPPADEQQEMQQKMMKYMMIFFGLMFYKVAAGLCVYFISSSMWGFAERKLLPKKKKLNPEASAESLFQRIIKRGENGSRPPDSQTTSITTSVPATGSISTSATQEARGGSKRKKVKRRREDGSIRSGPGAPESSVAPDGIRGWWQVRKDKLSAWWQELLRQAEKKR
jgi:YidC/Oxa1 family membrane protein insertase